VSGGFVDGVSRWCSRCQRWLPEESFRRNEAMLSGLHPWCRECVSDYAREWRAANREAVERYQAEQRERYAVGRGPLERVCVNEECGRTFMPSRRDARTCSEKCRSRLAYLRRRQRKGRAVSGWRLQPSPPQATPRAAS